MIDASGWGLPQVTYADGAVVLEEGRHHRELLVLISGIVRVSAQGADISTIDEPGAVFGEMAFLLDGAATATVTAVGECRFLRSDDPALLGRDHPEVALDIATTLAQRLDLVTRYLADLRNQYADREDHLSVVDTVLQSLVQRQPSGQEPGSDREPEAPY
jgi:CRP/FNR family cyclic AMP-dependent transcriptional regulator